MTTPSRRQVEVRVSGDRQVVAALAAKRYRIEDARPILDAFGDALASATRRVFETQGGRLLAQRWAPLSPDYAAWKLARVGPKPILQFSGRLMESVTTRPFAVEFIGLQRATFGTDVDYAIFHHKGTRFMPQRRFLAVTPALERELGRLTRLHLRGELLP